MKVAHDALRAEGAREASTYEAVAQIEADDAAHVVTFRLAHPAAYLLNKMTAPSHVIAPPEVLADPDQVNWVRDSIGTGPFTLGYSSGVGKWSVTRKPELFQTRRRDRRAAALFGRRQRRRPGLRSAVSNHRAHPARRVGGTGTCRVFGWRELPRLRRRWTRIRDAVLQVTAPTPGQAPLLTFRSLDGGPYRDARVRRALSMALDRTELAASVYDGFRCAGLRPALGLC